ncbi:MAG: FliM/FliN family flagellar motor C-terminal domain-containing protein [Pseudomonadota bacterium]
MGLDIVGKKAVPSLIAAGTGIPPSLKRNKLFWRTVEQATAQWLAQTLGTDEVAERVSQQVVNGDAAKASVEDLYVAEIAPDGNLGLAAIAITQPVAERLVASRLEGLGGSPSGASSVFLKLLFENTVTSLCNDFVARLSAGADAAGARETCAPKWEGAQVRRGIDASERYLVLNYDVPLGEQPGRLSLLLELPILQAGLSSVQMLAVERGPDAAGAEEAPIENTVRQSIVRLDAILDRIAMNVGECARLEPGQVIPLPGVDTENLHLLADTASGVLDIGAGRLGTWKVNRAVMLTEPAGRDLSERIASL